MLDIVIPHSNADSYRTRNLFFSVKYYKEYLPDSNIVIVEQNTVTEITEIKDLVGSHVRIAMPEALICKSYLLNEGYNTHKNKHLLFADTDCVVDKNILMNINDLLPTLEKHVVLPYDKPVVNLTESQTNLLVTNHEFFNSADEHLTRRVGVSNGGVVMVSSDNYYKLGGHDPRFVGWGGEDDAFYLKASKTIGVVRLDHDLFHLYHPKGVHCSAANPHYEKNYQHYMEYLHADTDKMHRMINTIGFDHLKNEQRPDHEPRAENRNVPVIRVKRAD